MKGLRLLVLGLFALFSIPILASATATFTDREPPTAICVDIQAPLAFEVSIQPKVIYRKPCAAKIDSADIAREKEYFRSLQTLARSRVKVRCGTSATSPSYIY
jgi:hypothetical protein